MRPTAVVTGGGRGIGRAVVDALAHDAWVAAFDVAFPHASTPASLTVDVNVTDVREVAKAVDQVVAERGGVDWVVCAAGIVRDRVSWKMTDTDWEEVIAVNLTGAFNVARATAQRLRVSRCGRLVFIGSINGTRGRFGQANYAASKAGLVGLARSLALELAREHVTVNVITPGFIETDMTRDLPETVRQRSIERTPLGRTGRPEEVASAVRFLCGDSAGFVTGAVLPIDGGQLLGSV